METGKLGSKDPWVDIVKWVACMLVLLGHFFQSMIKSGIISHTMLFTWFQHTIYLFHVPLFFICSGYLYQRNSRVTTLGEWKDNVIKKAVKLGVPYVTFSCLTYLLKVIFQDSVNTENENGLLYTLIKDPLSPFWYLYILFFIFLFTPTFRNKKQAWIGFVFALLIFPLQHNEWVKQIYFLQGVTRREVWFVIGMALCFYRDKIRFNINWFCLCLLLFPVSIWGCAHEMDLNALLVYNFVMGIMGCFLVLEIAFFFNDKAPHKMIEFSRRNTMPIFLMHTIFASGIRSILLKLGIVDTGIHILLGISGSIFLPVIAAEIMRKSRWMYFVINPEIKRKGKME